MKQLCVALGVIVFLPLSAVAAEFTASVTDDHVEAGKKFTLQLTLSGAKAKASPDIAALKQSFTIISQIHSANATANGPSVNFNVGWELVLLPKREGQIAIPPVAIESSVGTLRTAAIDLHVEKPTPAMPSQASGDGGKVSISASASNSTPYRNQPIRYTIKCVVRGGISKVAMEDISIPNAIVERQGKPKVYDDVEKGVPVRVVEIHYLITPLQPGRVVIPPAVLKGEIQAPAFAPMVDPFGGQFMLSPQTQRALNFFSMYGGEPFAIASNQTVLDVKSSIGAMDPWLPLRSLKISEDIGAARTVRVGDLVTRKIKLLAEGAVGAQLPNLETQQNHEDFGVYADKPETGEDVDDKTGAITGWRNESYSLVPQRSGKQTLPAVKVTWWDIANKKAETVILPARVIVVLPSAALGKPPVEAAASAGKDETPGQSLSEQSFRARFSPSSLVYLLIGAIAVTLLLFAAWIWRFRLKAIAARRAKTIRAERALKKIRTIEELRDFLRDYGHEWLGKPVSASLEEIFSDLPKSWKERDKAAVATVIKDINAALYAGRPADVEDIKNRCRRIIAALRHQTTGDAKSNEQLPLLNPS